MRNWVWFGLGIALILAVFVSPYASPWPDGLERVADDFGFINYTVEEATVSSPIPDYAVPGVQNEALATGLAGLAGTLLVFIFAILVGKFLKSREGPRYRD